jgi:hypothetical protein
MVLRIAAFVAVWMLYFAVVEHTSSIHNDMAEAYAWGREFQLGYNQHPPFWAWVCGAWFLMFPRTDWSFALLDAVNAGIGLAGAWALIGDFASGSRRVAGFALLLLTPIYTLGAYKYDANTIFLSLWPWMTHAFVRAMRTEPSGPGGLFAPARSYKGRGAFGRIGWSLGFGALAAAAMLSKYFAVVPLLVCGLGALATREGRDWLRSASPWVAFATCALLCAPHVVWLLAAGAPPLRYFGTASGLAFGVVGPAALTSFATDLAYFIAVVLAVIWFGRRTPRGAPPLLTILALGPFVLTLLSGVALGVRLTPEMAIGVLGLIPLWLIETVGPEQTDALARFSRRAAIGVTVAAAAVSPLVMAARAFVGKNAERVAPYPEAADAVGRLYRARFAAPLAYVAGAEYAHYVAFYGPDRAQAFFRFDYAANLWVTPERLAERGWAAVCAEADVECAAKAQEMAGATTQRVELTASRRFLGHVAEARRIRVWMTPPGGGG